MFLVELPCFIWCMLRESKEKLLERWYFRLRTKRLRECWRKRIKWLHKVTQSRSSILRHMKESQRKMVTQWLHKPQKLNQVQHQLRQTFVKEGYTSRSRSWAPLRMYCAWNLRDITKRAKFLRVWVAETCAKNIKRPANSIKNNSPG